MRSARGRPRHTKDKLIELRSVY